MKTESEINQILETKVHDYRVQKIATTKFSVYVEVNIEELHSQELQRFLKIMSEYMAVEGWFHVSNILTVAGSQKEYSLI